MPVFTYRALDAKGRNFEDEIVADSSEAAREALRSKGLFPVSVRDSDGGRKPTTSWSLAFWKKSVNASELTELTRQLATLLKADLQIIPALSILVRQSRKETGRRLLLRVREDVNEGKSLAGALEEHPRVFPEMYVSMVRAGEASGSLGMVLERLAAYLELQRNLRRRISGALAYPALMVLTGFSVVVFLLSFVIPRVIQLFQRAGREMPWPTRVLIFISDFLTTYGEILLVAVIGLGAAWLFWLRTDQGRWFWDNLKLRVPLLGNLYRTQAIARFGRTLGVLLASGLPILDSLSIAKLVLSNRVLESAVEQARDETHRGGVFSASLERSRNFPPVFTDMVGVGEQSGHLDEMLLHVAGHMEQESESTIQTMLSLVDPILILIMGVIVGFVVVAILLPLFEISQLVR